MDRFEDMRCFVHVAELQSVTRAAETLNLAPSAVSRRLKDLEARLGAQLLIRTTRRMRLTEAGQVFFRRSCRILDDLAEAEGEVADESRGLSGPLRLAAPLSFGLAHVSPIVTDFMLAHPDITIDLDLSDRMVDIVGEGFDLALRIGSLSDSSLIAAKLATVRMLACAAPGFLEERGAPQRAEDLKALPALCYSGSDRADIWRYRDAGGREASVQVPMRMRANTGNVLCDAAAAGLGVVLQPSFIAEPALRSGRLEVILGDVAWPEVAIHAVYPQTRHLSAKARALIDYLRARLGPHPYWEDFLEGG